MKIASSFKAEDLQTLAVTFRRLFNERIQNGFQAKVRYIQDDMTDFKKIDFISK